MRPREDVKRRVTSGWLRKAETDRGVAEHLLSEGTVFPDAIAFHAQQAAEKHLKALLVWHEVDFPKTHDLGLLLDLVQTVDAPLAEALRDVIGLTPYGVGWRYPSDRPDVTAEEARGAAQLAGKVAEAVRARLKGL